MGRLHHQTVQPELPQQQDHPAAHQTRALPGADEAPADADPRRSETLESADEKFLQEIAEIVNKHLGDP